MISVIPSGLRNSSKTSCKVEQKGFKLFSRTVIMAIWNQATDLATRQVIWVSTNIRAGRPQLNSHRSECYARDNIDGFPAAEIAGLHTSYAGNDWQAKIVEFQERWGC